jgi:thiosulfate/3-mercaptopyruvate sulfurtransferase
MAETYAHPEVLVTTDWVDRNRGNVRDLRIVESDEDVLLYNMGHIPEAIRIDWINDLNDPVMRDYIDVDRFGELCARNGIGNDTTVVFYGDKSNWWACYAFWVFKLFGHPRCLIMDGGRMKWEAEKRAMSKSAPLYRREPYSVVLKDESIRAFREDALRQSQDRLPLVDVRSVPEFTGERTHMPEYPQEGVLRGGHIPGARNVPWAMAANADGTFKRRSELEEIYLRDLRLKAEDDVIVYCRIGERSSHTWFVLTYLLGFNHVRNYDGSWTEWGNSVRLPIERQAHMPQAVIVESP